MKDVVETEAICKDERDPYNCDNASNFESGLRGGGVKEGKTIKLFIE